MGGLFKLIAVLVATAVAAYAAYVIPGQALGNFFAALFGARAAVMGQTAGGIMFILVGWVACRCGANKIWLHLTTLAAWIIAGIHGWFELRRLADLIGWDDPSGQITMPMMAWMSFDIWMILGFLIVGGSSWIAHFGLPDISKLQLAPGVKRSVNTTFGDASWESPERKMKELSYQNPRATIALALQEDLQNATSLTPYLVIDGADAGAQLIVAAQGGGKSAGLLVSQLLNCDGPNPFNAIVYDPKGELYRLTKEYRQSINGGRRVLLVDPNGKETACWDFFATLDPENKDDFAMQIATAVYSIVPRDDTVGKDKFWENSGLALVGTVVASVAADVFLMDAEKTVGRVWSRLNQDEKTLQMMLGYTAKFATSELVKEKCQRFAGMSENTFSGVCATARDLVSFFEFPKARRIMEGKPGMPGYFNMKQLVTGSNPPDMFIKWPNRLSTSDLAGAMRATFNTVIDLALETAQSSPTGMLENRLHVMCDEARLIGASRQLEQVRDQGRGAKISCCVIFQDTAQLYRSFGQEGGKSWLKGSPVQIYFRVVDEDDAERLVKWLGDYTAENESVTNHKGDAIGQLALIGSTNESAGKNLGAVQAKLMTISDVMTMPQGEALIRIAGYKPIKAALAMWFKRPDLVAKVEGRLKWSPKIVDLRDWQPTKIGQAKDYFGRARHWTGEMVTRIRYGTVPAGE